MRAGMRTFRLVGATLCAGLFAGLLIALSASQADAQRLRGYYVVLGSFGEEYAARDRFNSPCLVRSGYEIVLVDSNRVEGFRSGLWVVIAGPFRRQHEANDARADLRRCVRDAYVKYGRED